MKNLQETFFLMKVHPPSPPMAGPLANFLLSTRDDSETFRRRASEHISSLSACISTSLAETCAYMSQVAIYRTYVSTSPTYSTVLFVWNTRLDDFRLLARLPYRFGVRWFSSTQSPRSWGQSQYPRRTRAVWLCKLNQPHRDNFAPEEIICNQEAVLRIGRPDSSVWRWRATGVMTTCDYDSDANFFCLLLPYYHPFRSRLYYHPALFSFCLNLVLLLSCTLYSYHRLASTAWPMTHNDAGGCATSLFQGFLLFSIWLIVTHLRTLIYYKLWTFYYKYHFSICSRP